MQVILRRDWYKNGFLYRKGTKKNDPVEIPDRYADELPHGAVVVEGPEKPAKPAKADKKAGKEALDKILSGD